jgi:hypothetical protein
MGRNEEANKEFAAERKKLASGLDKERKNLENDQIPNPELTRQPD